MHRKFKELGNFFFFFFVSKFFKIHFFVEQSSINQTLETEKFDAEREKFVEMMRESVEQKVFLFYLFFFTRKSQFFRKKLSTKSTNYSQQWYFFFSFFFYFLIFC